jgi:hypothetical protein
MNLDDNSDAESTPLRHFPLPVTGAKQMDDSLFDQLKPIGSELPPIAAVKLLEVGETSAAEQLNAVSATRSGSFRRRRSIWPFQDRPWQHTSHIFGYVPTRDAGSETIRFAGEVKPDDSLKGAAIKITLDRLRVTDYPGGSTHNVLLHFFGRNQTSKKQQEDVNYSILLDVREGDHAALISIPIFVGLNVGTEGISFRCVTVNVKNADDEALLSFLDSDVFKSGLTLLKVAQPALLPFAHMTAGVTKRIASRNRNITVQKFDMGLDFSNILTRARLAEGSYIAMQVPSTAEAHWDWGEWAFRPASGHIVKTNDPSILPPYNYVIFSISRIE